MLLLGQFPLGRDLSGEARERLRILAGAVNGEALVDSFIKEYHIYYRVSEFTNILTLISKSV